MRVATQEEGGNACSLRYRAEDPAPDPDLLLQRSPPPPTGVPEPEGQDFAAKPSTEGRIVVGDSATGEVRVGGDRDRFAVEPEVARRIASTPISAIRDRSRSIMRDQGPPLDHRHDRGAATRDGFRFNLKPLATSGMDGP